MNSAAKKGFTLIELLIVVAIIAILAAIAVPNFLEAQTRAKVARIKSDQRSLAIAIEAYTIDWNRPVAGDGEAMASIPTYWVPGSTVFGIPPTQVAYEMLWGHYTTPISYISSIPKDFFLQTNSGVAMKNIGGAGGWQPMQGHKGYMGYETFPMSGKGTGQGAAWYGFDANGTTWAFLEQRARGLGFTWALWSVGPWRSELHSTKTRGPGGLAGVVAACAGVGDPFPDYPNALYDPTNGTVSFGKIVRTNKGVAPDGFSAKYTARFN